MEDKLPIGIEPHFSRYCAFIFSRPKRSNSLKYEKGYARHHIVPRALGGFNSLENIIKLTTREHFIAHMILSKCYGQKMSIAFYLMYTCKKCSRHLASRQYEVLRFEVSQIKRVSKFRGIPQPPRAYRKKSRSKSGPNKICRLSPTNVRRP